MNSIIDFFKKKNKVQTISTGSKPIQTKSFDIENFKANYNELYECSVQKTPKDFTVTTIDDGKPVTTAMDSLDGFSLKNFENAYTPNMLGQEIIYTYFAKQGFIGFNNCAILAQDWLVNKAISTPCDEAIATDYEINLVGEEVEDEDTNLLEELKNISEKRDKYNIKEVCKEFAINKRKYGQALCIPLVENADYENPFNIESIKKNSYKGMSVIEPNWVSPVLDSDASTNPVSERFYKPTWFRLPNGKHIHYTWFIFNTYGIVSDILKPTYYFGGLPLPQLLYEQAYAAHKTAKEAPMLAQSKRLNYMEGNLNAYLLDETRLQNEINLMSWLRNNWGWLFIKKDQRIGQLDTSLTDFDAVTMLGYQLVAAISGVPSAKLLETSPKGWQSTGSYEEDNYKMLLLNIQHNDFEPILNLHYQLLTKSKYEQTKYFKTKFDDIDVPTEKERAEINEIKSRTDAAYIDSGVISPEEVRDSLRNDAKSGYNALTEEMQGDPAENDDPFGDLLGGSETPQNPFSGDEWEESKHPRKENGQFGKGGGNSENESNNKDIKSLLGEEIKGVKGQEAINALLEKQAGHVKGAFNRPDIGDIDLIWGDDYKGIKHIIKQREKQNIDTKTFFKDLGEVIEKGDIRISPEKGNFELLYNGKMAIIAPTLENNKMNFLLTAFKTSRKKHKK